MILEPDVENEAMIRWRRRQNHHPTHSAARSERFSPPSMNADACYIIQCPGPESIDTEPRPEGTVKPLAFSHSGPFPAVPSLVVPLL